ncbi:MAG TPA: hypothetical protein VM425_13550 [Myxococcota bacterium]|nr:hypothetical protein [Myxococcota bacterium]
MIDVILGVDVEAEIVKLSLGRLESRAHVPLALARLAAAGRAGTVRIGLSRRRLELWHDGETLDRQTVELLSVVLDRQGSEWVRHDALGKLESAGMLDLLVAFTPAAERTRLELGEPQSLLIEFERRGRGLRVGRKAGMQGTRITVHGKRPDLRREIDELQNSLGYARFTVELNGRRVDRGPHLVDVLAEMRYSDEHFRCLVGIPRSGLVATTRILHNGVLGATICKSPPDGLVYEALIEIEASGDSQAALGFAHRSAADLIDRATDKIDQMPTADRERMRRLLFRMVARGSGFGVLKAAHLFATCRGERVTVEELRRSALGRIVRAVAPGARFELFDMGSGTVFLLDEADRAFVEKSLRLLVREPPRRTIERAIIRLWRRWREKAGSWRARIAERLAGGRLPRCELCRQELEFLERLEGLLQAGLAPSLSANRAEFRSGRIGACRLVEDNGQKVLLLSLGHPVVRRMIEAVARDPRMLYATLVALAGGKDAFGSARERIEGYFMGTQAGG